MQSIDASTTLYLFNYDTRHIYGVFQADGRAALAIEPEAFQVRRSHAIAAVRASAALGKQPIRCERFTLNQSTGPWIESWPIHYLSALCFQSVIRVS